jgi:hypothetical protein
VEGKIFQDRKRMKFCMTGDPEEPGRMGSTPQKEQLVWAAGRMGDVLRHYR